MFRFVRLQHRTIGECKTPEVIRFVPKGLSEAFKWITLSCVGFFFLKEKP